MPLASQITVHPIGGANISRDGSSAFGVTTELGELLTGNANDIYGGLVVVDGAVIPCALGVNPLAAITAFAERSVEAVAQKNGIEIYYETKNGNFFYSSYFQREKYQFAVCRYIGPFWPTSEVPARYRRWVWPCADSHQKGPGRIKERNPIFRDHERVPVPGK